MKEWSQRKIHIMVGLDGSRLAETVLPLVRTLVRALGARLTLLHVLELEPPTTVHGEAHLKTIAQANAYLKSIMGSVEEEGLPVESHTHANPEHDVAAAIAAHATQFDADLIVLCAHGHGGLRDWMVGRIPQQVVALAARPVLIVPAPSKGDYSLVSRILFPINQAGEVGAALTIVQHVAAACHSEVILITVVPTVRTVPGNASASTVFLPQTTATLLEWAVDQARNQLLELRENMTRGGLTVQTEVRRGDPAREIAQAITTHRPDLVVMATHGRSGIGGLWAGSVAPRIVTPALCPVLLVPMTK